MQPLQNNTLKVAAKLGKTLVSSRRKEQKLVNFV